jgi:hypothetical protein
MQKSFNRGTERWSIAHKFKFVPSIRSLTSSQLTFVLLPQVFAILAIRAPACAVFFFGGGGGGGGGGGSMLEIKKRLHLKFHVPGIPWFMA